MTYKAFQVDKGDMPALIAAIKRNRRAWLNETGSEAGTLLVNRSIHVTMAKIFSKRLHVKPHAMPNGVFGITS